ARRRARRRLWLQRVAVGVWSVVMIGLAAGVIKPNDAPIAFFERMAGSFTSSHQSEAITSTGAAAGLMRFQANLTTKARVTPSPTSAPSSTSIEESPATTTVITSPTPVAPVYAAGSIAGIISQAAGEFGLSSSYLISVAECESNLDPHAYNGAGYYGLFQFDQTTWSAYGYGSIYDPAAQARTAARLLAAGESSRWPNCA
ncbi:MAG: transglycosylase family protein, partial [Actinomycetota bacterium]|nr:transglycosylase family protein [Actinomycetota bacterium]